MMTLWSHTQEANRGEGKNAASVPFRLLGTHPRREAKLSFPRTKDGAVTFLLFQDTPLATRPFFLDKNKPSYGKRTVTP